MSEARPERGPGQGEVTRLLAAWGRGGEAERRLFELIEPELVKLARSVLRRNPNMGRRLEPEELVSETYVRLKAYLGQRQDVSFENRRYFYSMVVTVMRNLLLDMVKRGGKARPQTARIFTMSAAEHVPDGPAGIDAYAFYQALDRLKAKNERQARAIELHYIIGLTLDDSANLMGLSTATLKRQLAAARQWFEQQLLGNESEAGPGREPARSASGRSGR